jgi:hypothetical protein
MGAWILSSLGAGRELTEGRKAEGGRWVEGWKCGAAAAWGGPCARAVATVHPPSGAA